MNRITAIFLVSASAIGFAFSQSEGLQSLQATYDKEVLRVTTPVTLQYKNALQKLQQKFVEENKLEEALMVKKEIESLDKAPLPVATDPSPKMEVSPTPESTAAAGEWDYRGWKGDHKVTKEDGESVIELEGVKVGTKFFSRHLEVKDFPAGLNVIFQYKSKNFEGDGVELRAARADQSHTFRNPTLIFDGEWHEYVWPFSDYRGNKEIHFQFLLKNGSGTVQFKDIKFSAL